MSSVSTGRVVNGEGSQEDRTGQIKASSGWGSENQGALKKKPILGRSEPAEALGSAPKGNGPLAVEALFARL